MGMEIREGAVLGSGQLDAGKDNGAAEARRGVESVLFYC